MTIIAPRTLPRWAPSLIAPVAGAASVLGFAPFHFWPIYAAALCVLVLLIDGAVQSARPLRSAFWRGWLFAFGAFLGGLNWVANAFFVDAEKFGLLAIPAVLALPAGLALFWGAAASLSAAFWTQGPARIFLFAGVFGLTELARSTILTGFPWNLPGHIWPAGGTVSQSASVIGLHGLSVLTLLVMSAPVLVLAPGPVRARLIPVAIAALTLGGMALFGVVRLSGADTAVNTGGPYVAVVDAGFTQREKWDPANRDRVAERYLALLDDPAAQQASVIIWPEGALPFPLLEDAPTLAALEQKLGTRALATGLVRRDFVPPDQSTWFNSLIVMSRDERGLALRSLYDKNHLVPFGEYVPLGPLFDALGLRSLVSYGVDFTPGPLPAPIAVPGLPEAWPLICYEAIFPVTIPDSARPGWLLNVSVDAWFGQAQGPAQHFNQARYRAIETGLPLVRSASGGPSGIVDSLGRVIAATDAAGGVVSAPLPPKVQRPLQLGIAYFPGFLIVLCLSVRLAMIVSHRRLAQSAREEMPYV